MKNRFNDHDRSINSRKNFRVKDSKESDYFDACAEEKEEDYKLVDRGWKKGEEKNRERLVFRMRGIKSNLS